jgi:membrane-bound metal-dependent hydrolase YbcI (DUF457 family)
MAFTFSHPAAALLLRKTSLVFSAVVAGSVAPDLEFFVRLSPQRFVSHSLAGTFLFSLPAGLLLLALYHRVLRQPLVWLLPASHRARINARSRPFAFGPARRFIGVTISVLVGALTHLLWDSFTHGEGWWASRIQLLRRSFITIEGIGTARGYFILHYLSSAAGVACLAYAYARWYRGAAMGDGRVHLRLSRAAKVRLMLGMLAGALLGGAGFAVAVAPSANDMAVAKELVSHTAVATVSFFGAATVVFSGVWHVLSRKAKQALAVTPR